MMASSKCRHHPKNSKKKKKTVQGRALNVGKYASWTFFEDPILDDLPPQSREEKRKPTERLAEEPKFEIKKRRG